MAEAYVLYDDIRQARKLYDCDSMAIPAGGTAKYTARIEDSLCAPPHLSHIIRIGGAAFAEFDTGLFKRRTENPASPEAFSVAGTVPVSVDWTQDGGPVLETGEESLNVTEELPEIKIICTVTIQDEADIP